MGVAFTKPAATRIAKAVKYVEGLSGTELPTGRKGRRPRGGGSNSFQYAIGSLNEDALIHDELGNVLDPIPTVDIKVVESIGGTDTDVWENLANGTTLGDDTIVTVENKLRLPGAEDSRCMIVRDLVTEQEEGEEYKSFFFTDVEPQAIFLPVNLQADSDQLQWRLQMHYTHGMYDPKDWALWAQGGRCAAQGLLTEPARLIVPLGDELSVAYVGTAKVTFRMPFAMHVMAVRLSLNDAPTGADFIVDINEGGTSIFGATKLTVDDGEESSETSAATWTIDDPNLADDAEITIDIDQVGSTNPGKGPKVALIGREQ